MKIIKAMSLLLAILSLTACGREDAASYYIDGSSRHSFSLMRDKPFFWSGGWDVSLVVTQVPECLRKHKLAHAPDDNFKTEFYRTYDGAYILREDNNWFVAETRKCQLQQFKTPPPEPGELLGAFQEKDGILQFVATGKPPAAQR